MKKNLPHLLLVCAIVSFSFSVCAVPLSGIYCIGSSSAYSPPSGPAYVNGGLPYSSLTAAMTDLNVLGASGNVIFELQNDYTSASENNPLTLSYQGTASAAITVRVRSDLAGQLVIEAPRNNANSIGVLDFNGADYFTFDGTINSASCGSSFGLVIRNTGTFGKTVSFENDAQHNVLKGVQVDIAQGAAGIFLEYLSGVDGNDSNTFQCNRIQARADVANTPSGFTGIETQVNTGFASKNDNILISNNYFENCVTGIYVNGNGNNGLWTVTDNHFYKNSTPSSIGNFIFITLNDTGKIVVERNYMGGSAPFCGGAKMTVTNISTCVSVSTLATSASKSNFTENVIQNIADNNVSGATWYLLQANNNAWDIVGNTFGDPNTTGDLYSPGAFSFNGIIYSTNAPGFTSNITGNTFNNFDFPANAPFAIGDFIGILFSTAVGSNAVINYNSFKNISHGAGGSFWLMSASGNSNASSLSYNTAENIYQHYSSCNDFKAYYALGANWSLVGNRLGNAASANDIRLEGTNIPYLISLQTNSAGRLDSNGVYNVSCLNTGAYYRRAIYLGTGIASLQSSSCSWNTVKNFSTQSTFSTDPESFPQNGSSLCGIMVMGADSVNILNNEVSGLSVENSSNTQTLGLLGILIGTRNNTLNNKVHALLNSCTATSVYPYISGMYFGPSNSSVANNMVALSNGANSNGVRLFGMRTYNSARRLFYHNTIAISGNDPAGASSYAFYKDVSGSAADSLKNNIFYNGRSGSGKHYAIAHTSGVAGEWGASDYNELFSSTAATLGEWPTGTDQNFSQWQSISGGDTDSKNLPVAFENVSTDLHLIDSLNCSLNNSGTPVGLIWDIDGTLRSFTNPDIGADEFSCASSLSFLITFNSPLCEGSTITATPFVSGGTSPYSHSWTGPVSFSSNVAVLFVPGATPANAGRYYLTVTDFVGTVVKDSIDISIDPLPGAALPLSGDSLIVACAHQTGISYSTGPVPNASYYLWTVPAGAVITSGDSSTSVTVNYSAYSSSGNVTVAGGNACGTGTSITLPVTFKPIPLAEICRATIDSATQKTIIEWQKPAESYVSGYVIYRESSGTFIKIDTVLNTVFSSYTDTGSQPNLKAEKYKIAVLDSCGNIGDTSAIFEHQAINLYGSIQPGAVAKLYWNDYVGINDPSRYFKLVRDTLGNGPFNDTVATNISPNSFMNVTDINAASFPLCRYVIEMVYESNCTPGLRTLLNKSTSRSNIKNKSALFDSSSVGINAHSTQSFGIKIYPNPAKEILTVTLEGTDNKVILFLENIQGQILKQQEFNFLKNEKIHLEFPLENIPRGIYFIVVETEKGRHISKLSIE